MAASFPLINFPLCRYPGTFKKQLFARDGASERESRRMGPPPTARGWGAQARALALLSSRAEQEQVVAVQKSSQADVRQAGDEGSNGAAESADDPRARNSRKPCGGSARRRIVGRSSWSGCEQDATRRRAARGTTRATTRTTRWGCSVSTLISVASARASGPSSSGSAPTGARPSPPSSWPRRRRARR